MINNNKTVMPDKTNGKPLITRNPDKTNGNPFITRNPFAPISSSPGNATENYTDVGSDGFASDDDLYEEKNRKQMEMREKLQPGLSLSIGNFDVTGDVTGVATGASSLASLSLSPHPCAPRTNGAKNTRRTVSPCMPHQSTRRTVSLSMPHQSTRRTVRTD